MTESVDEPELPPFSFSKKAVTLHNNIIHSAISDIIPSRNSEDRSLTPSTTNEQLNVAYNNIDYDEQIRAPRMNNVNYYTYTSKQKVNRGTRYPCIGKILLIVRKTLQLRQQLQILPLQMRLNRGRIREKMSIRRQYLI